MARGRQRRSGAVSGKPVLETAKEFAGAARRRRWISNTAVARRRMRDSGGRCPGVCHRRRQLGLHCIFSARLRHAASRGRDVLTLRQGYRRCHGVGHSIPWATVMSALAREMQQRYSEAFASYLAGANEVALNQAYELGRKALADGLGVLDIAITHHNALDAVVEGESAIARSVDIAKAAEFLAETLSPFEMSLRGYRDTNDRLIAMNETLAQARAAAEAANLELEAFSYSVAHDLRAPLRGVDGFSRALLEDYAAKFDDRGRGYLKHLRESAQRMGRLIDDLLALSRVTRSELARE